MKLRALSRAEVREIDRRAIEQFGIPGLILMENAGHEAARWLAELGIDGPVVICCGKGNNGGDGYVMARHLDAWGHAVQILLAADPSELEGDARINFQIAERSGIPIIPWKPAAAETTSGALVNVLGPPRIARLIQDAAWIVDGLLGTGIEGTVRDPIRSAIETVNGCPARRFAIDIPSGLDCDTGRPLGMAVRASCTATFVSTKLGFSNPEAAAYTGMIRVIDIGIPAKLLQTYASEPRA